MRTLSTLVFASLAIGTINAQQAAPIATSDTPIDVGAVPTPSGVHHSPHSQGQPKAAITNLGLAGNVYTILLSSQNQVSYDPDINSVTFVHRQNPDDFSGQGGNGTLRFDVSTDGGASWTLNRLLTPTLFNGSADTIIGARYPSATLYNPAGNTDPNNAYLVSTGMVLNSLDTSLDYTNTGHIQYSSARLDGAFETNAFTDLYGDRTTYPAYGLSTKSDGTLWSMSTRQSNSTLNADTINFKELRVNKGVWNDVDHHVDWSTMATLAPQLVVYDDSDADGSKDVQVNTWNMGFSPDGQTGYAVILGKEWDGITSGPMPLVWKTTDGGNNWNQLPNHAFGDEQWMIDNIYPANDNSETRPYFSDMDLTVDANGRLHVIASVLSQYYGNSPDSVNYIFTALESQFLIHVSTTDGVSWTIAKLSDKIAPDHEYPIDIVAPPGPFQTDRPQACRTLDGSHVFFTWNRSADGEVENFFPEIHGVGYNVSNNMWTEPKSLSAGTDADAVAWWHTVSPVCITNGDDYDFELPTVFADPGDYADVVSGFTYIKGIGFDETEFIVGMEEIGNTGSVNAYPNPGEGLFTIALVNTGNAEIQVTDVTGRVVRAFRTTATQAQIDLRDEASGLYTLTVTSAKGRLSKKLVVR